MPPFKRKRRGRGRAYEIVQLHCGDATIYTRDNLLGNSYRINMVDIQTVAQPRDTSSDFVELDALLATIWREKLARKPTERRTKPLGLTSLSDKHCDETQRNPQRATCRRGDVKRRERRKWGTREVQSSLLRMSTGDQARCHNSSEQARNAGKWSKDGRTLSRVQMICQGRVGGKGSVGPTTGKAFLSATRSLQRLRRVKPVASATNPASALNTASLMLSFDPFSSNATHARPCLFRRMD